MLRHFCYCLSPLARTRPTFRSDAKWGSKESAKQCGKAERMPVMKERVTVSNEVTFNSKLVQSVSDTVTGWTTREQEFESRRGGLQSISSPPRLNRNWAPRSLLTDKCPGFSGAAR